MGEYLISRVLILEAISEVSQYEFNMKKMTVYSKHIMIPDNEGEGRGIAGLETTENPYIVVIISTFTEIQ